MRILALAFIQISIAMTAEMPAKWYKLNSSIEKEIKTIGSIKTKKGARKDKG